MSPGSEPTGYPSVKSTGVPPRENTFLQANYQHGLPEVTVPVSAATSLANIAHLLCARHPTLLLENEEDFWVLGFAATGQFPAMGSHSTNLATWSPQ